MVRLTKKNFIADLRYELNESVGETYNDTYFLKWLSDANKRFLSGVPMGGEANFEPLYPSWAKDVVTKTLESASDTVAVDNSVRRILKVNVNGADYTPVKFEDFFDLESGELSYTMTANGLLFPNDLVSGTVVKVISDIWDNDILESDDDDTTFSVIRPVYEKYLKDYVIGVAKRKNEYAASLATDYFQDFNDGIFLARREGNNFLAEELPSAKVMDQLFV